MSVGGTGMLSAGYDDIEMQQLTIQHSFTGDGSNDQGLDTTAIETPTGDLDRDELAELIFVRLQATMSIRDKGPDNQSVPGNARTDYKVFINELDSAQDSEKEETTVTGTGVQNPVQNALTRNEAANLIFDFNNVVQPGFREAADGVGGGSDGGETEILEMDYMEMGGGPVLDRFDDIKLKVSTSASSVVTKVSSEVRCQFYYRVEEFEDRGIQSFGRP